VVLGNKHNNDLLCGNFTILFAVLREKKGLLIYVFRFSISQKILSLSILLDKVIIIDYIIMSKYIHPENQTIVWEILNKIPIIKTHMSLEFEQFLIDLFKETICFFYENNKDKNLTFRELETLNKETIDYINVKVKSIYNILPATTPLSITPINDISIQSNNNNNVMLEHFKNVNIPETINITENLSNKPADDTKNAYIPFQTPKPTESPFEKMIDDEPISNMEELIEQYKKQREYDNDTQIVLPKAII
jgi:hypothetical protein